MHVCVWHWRIPTFPKLHSFNQNGSCSSKVGQKKMEATLVTTEILFIELHAVKKINKKNWRGRHFVQPQQQEKNNNSLLMDLKRQNLCASCARIYECSACWPQQGEKITLGITSVNHVRRDYGCSSGYWRIFPRFQSYVWGRSKWTSYKTLTNPHQISSIKRIPCWRRSCSPES